MLIEPNDFMPISNEFRRIFGASYNIVVERRFGKRGVKMIKKLIE